MISSTLEEKREHFYTLKSYSAHRQVLWLATIFIEEDMQSTERVKRL